MFSLWFKEKIIIKYICTSQILETELQCSHRGISIKRLVLSIKSKFVFFIKKLNYSELENTRWSAGDERMYTLGPRGHPRSDFCSNKTNLIVTVRNDSHISYWKKKLKLPWNAMDNLQHQQQLSRMTQYNTYSCKPIPVAWTYHSNVNHSLSYSFSPLLYQDYSEDVAEPRPTTQACLLAKKLDQLRNYWPRPHGSGTQTCHV